MRPVEIDVKVRDKDMVVVVTRFDPPRYVRAADPAGDVIDPGELTWHLVYQDGSDAWDIESSLSDDEETCLLQEIMDELS